MHFLLKKTVLLAFLAFLPAPLFSQLIIDTDTLATALPLPPQWRGHNHTAQSPITWYNVPDYTPKYKKLHAGIERWPGGNSGNNYRWQPDLKNSGRFHLKNVASYMDRFGTELQIVVNFGNGSPAETAYLLRICNSSLPHYRQLRDSLLNHPDPLNVKLWEIGNESTDAWAFAWSWLGFQDHIYFQSGQQAIALSKKEADSLYYFGGEFYRQGWVDVIGGLTLRTAILGDIHFYPQAMPGDTVKVEFPALDTNNASAIRIYRTSNFNVAWADSLTSPGPLYDSIAKPRNLLSPQEYDYSPEKVFLHPAGGLKSNDLILIEYLSTGHSGAFEFRDSIKANDPGSQVGYTVKITPELESMPGFIDRFRQSPPDFMIEHPYATALTKPALENAYFSESAYVAQFKTEQMLALQQTWNQRKKDWNLAHVPGLGITEWNIGLCDDCPENHPFDGIASALYVADFWGRMIEKAFQDSLHLAVINHFALVATGDNFIHLLHPNGKGISVGPEGRAVQMLMQVIAEGFFKPGIEQMPTMAIDDGSGSQTVDALSVYGGLSPDKERIRLLIVNRDDENAHPLLWPLPDSWLCDSLLVESYTGSMIDSQTNHQIQRQAFNDSLLSLSLPAYSLVRIEIKLAVPLGRQDRINREDGSLRIYPNPAGNKVYIRSEQDLEWVELYDLSGRLLTRRHAKGRRFEMALDEVPRGIYLFRISSSGATVNRRVIRY